MAFTVLTLFSRHQESMNLLDAGGLALPRWLSRFLLKCDYIQTTGRQTVCRQA